MGNLVGVVAAISAGGAGAVFWMWITALLGSSTAFIEGTLAQLHKEKDPLYGGYHGGPAYYMHHFFAKRKDGTYRKYSVLAVLFAISGLICWCGISQVISNVPAALLLSNFTDQWEQLIIGTNLGGLGTLIASMASLISYKQVAAEYPEKKGRYLAVFTWWNLLFLAALIW